MAAVKARRASDGSLPSPGACGWKIVAAKVQESARRGLILCDTIARVSFGILAMRDNTSTGTLAESSDDKPKKCDKDPAPAPEPDALILLSAELVGLGGMSVLRRRSQSQ
jgi:hypothetical protein